MRLTLKKGHYLVGICASVAGIVGIFMHHESHQTTITSNQGSGTQIVNNGGQVTNQVLMPRPISAKIEDFSALYTNSAERVQIRCSSDTRDMVKQMMQGKTAQQINTNAQCDQRNAKDEWELTLYFSNNGEAALEDSLLTIKTARQNFLRENSGVWPPA